MWIPFDTCFSMTFFTTFAAMGVHLILFQLKSFLPFFKCFYHGCFFDLKPLQYSCVVNLDFKKNWFSKGIPNEWKICKWKKRKHFFFFFNNHMKKHRKLTWSHCICFLHEDELWLWVGLSGNKNNILIKAMYLE